MDSYRTWDIAHWPEDIVLCVDVDLEMDSELKKGHALTRMDAIKQALLMFVHSKLLMSADHAFSIATIGQGASWHSHQYLRDFDAISTSIRSLGSQGSYTKCDLSSLFQLILPDARASKKRSRAFRVILVYCRSNTVPKFNIHIPDPSLVVFDALYLHDKPNPSNCPQQVYDALVEILERVHAHSYIFESGGGLTRVLFRHICQLLAHPQQRCLQDDSLPVDLSKPNAPAAATDGSAQNQVDEKINSLAI
ncbi:uncharacterized protein LOC9632536 [Selaginella moellendorffii]|nr:uncharacterized protein LOC9632536 [Selaginella moellendorffii]|eukprot:XP_002961178.2 uncharacterized protein LOC9632536 [Selaginella moellendorffii]